MNDVSKCQKILSLLNRYRYRYRLIDDGKNTSNNTKTIVTILYNAKGSAAFLNAWDVTAESETSDRFICDNNIRSSIR